MFITCTGSLSTGISVGVNAVPVSVEFSFHGKEPFSISSFWMGSFVTSRLFRDIVTSRPVFSVEISLRSRARCLEESEREQSNTKENKKSH